MQHKMGAPELPGDPGDEDFSTVEIVQHPPIPSDESDDHDMDNNYEGYEPLAMDDISVDATHQNDYNEENQYDNAEVTHGDNNLPPVESIDIEIERQVWSEPRPLELEIELDKTKTEQILNAMANFTLPNVAVPDWAAGVPEERWKNDLLQRIRQRKDTTTVKSNRNNEQSTG